MISIFSINPYRQSERKGIYREYADQLVKSGWAYIAFDTPEEIDVFRKEAESIGETFSYGIGTRQSLKNSLKLSSEEVKEKMTADENYVIRFKTPEDVDVTEEDIIRGKVAFNTTKSLDDKVLFKSDGMPTYHLANVVDDYLMKITHVIRGEEWLPSLPLHVLLYRAFGWEKSKPKFAHMPLTLKPTGKGKLSKRDGDKMGFPVFPLPWKDPETGIVSRSYKGDGYFPEAFINMLVFLGWSPGTDQEFFTLDELTKVFSLERIVKAGSRFDPEKAKWFNKHYFQKKSDTDLVELFKPVLQAKNISAGDEKIRKVISLVKERCEFVSDLWTQGSFFFEAPTEYDTQTVKKRWKEDTPEQLNQITEIFQSVEPWNAESIKENFSDFMNEKGWGFGAVMNPLRLCLVGGNMGPDLFVICEILGKEETVARINNGIISIKN